MSTVEAERVHERERVERLIEEDRRAIEQARAARARQREAAERAKQTFRSSVRRTLRKAYG